MLSFQRFFPCLALLRQLSQVHPGDQTKVGIDLTGFFLLGYCWWFWVFSWCFYVFTSKNLVFEQKIYKNLVVDLRFLDMCCFFNLLIWFYARSESLVFKEICEKTWYVLRKMEVSRMSSFNPRTGALPRSPSCLDFCEVSHWIIPSGQRLHNYRKPHFLPGHLIVSYYFYGHVQ